MDNRRIRVQFSAVAKNIFFFTVHTGTWAHWASYQIGIRGPFPRSKAAGALSWALDSILCSGYEECAEVYPISPIFLCQQLLDFLQSRNWRTIPCHLSTNAEPDSLAVIYHIRRVDNSFFLWFLPLNIQIVLTIHMYYYGLLALLSRRIEMVVSCSYTAAPRERDKFMSASETWQRGPILTEALDRQVDDVSLNMDIALVRRLPQVGPLCNTFRWLISLRYIHFWSLGRHQISWPYDTLRNFKNYPPATAFQFLQASPSPLYS
jgi:hypothetical protein